MRVYFAFFFTSIPSFSHSLACLFSWSYNMKESNNGALVYLKSSPNYSFLLFLCACHLGMIFLCTNCSGPNFTAPTETNIYHWDHDVFLTPSLHGTLLVTG